MYVYLTVYTLHLTLPPAVISIAVNIYLPTYLPTYLSIYLSIYLYIYLSNLSLHSFVVSASFSACYCGTACNQTLEVLFPTSGEFSISNNWITKPTEQQRHSNELSSSKPHSSTFKWHDNKCKPFGYPSATSTYTNYVLTSFTAHLLSVVQVTQPNATVTLYFMTIIPSAKISGRRVEEWFTFSSFKVKNSTRWFKYDRDKLWLVYTQISPGHIWTTLYVNYLVLRQSLKTVSRIILHITR
jgi:hypothetical protein